MGPWRITGNVTRGAEWRDRGRTPPNGKYTPDDHRNVTVERHAALAGYSNADTPLSDTTRVC